jgi:hypothetical protein
MELQLPFNPDDLQQLWRRFTSVDKISAFDNLPKEFPSVEELTPLWMVLLSQKRALKATNPATTLMPLQKRATTLLLIAAVPKHLQDLNENFLSSPFSISSLETKLMLASRFAGIFFRNRLLYPSYF